MAAPDALCADGWRARYACTPEIEIPAVDGRPGRAALLGQAGFTVELLRLDAAGGTVQRLCDLDGVGPQLALGGGRLWVSGPSREEAGEDPVSLLRCLDLDGRQVSVTQLPGQIDAVAAGDTTVWVAGFRPSRQAGVLTALGREGTVVGEVSFARIDLGRWARATPPRAPRLPLPERARAVRDAVERALTEPRQVVSRFGDRWEEPPVSEAFRLERVELQGASDDPVIAVLFRWNGENDLFGLSYPICDDEDDLDDAPDGYISV